LRATNVLVAGAAGAVGKRLCPLLTSAGYSVYGTTRHKDTAASLRSAGVAPIIVDAFDAANLTAALADVRPEIVIHQLTDLSGMLEPGKMEAALRRNARIRIEGTRNLMSAAIQAGTRRLIAQSIAWIYADGPQPHGEDDPLDTGATGMRAVSVGGVVALEQSVLNSPKLEGIVLRYGHFYGPGTGVAARADAGIVHVHVDAAAHAALLAITRGRRGVYNVAESGPYATSNKAESELGWSFAFRSKLD
jgi:nucleoside-diphosphate-sugar epimerase